jgi:hypothetical protein
MLQLQAGQVVLGLVVLLVQQQVVATAAQVQMQVAAVVLELL